MRLIDADALIYEDITDEKGNTYMVVHAPQIDNAPTAYDVEKVVEELEEARSMNNGWEDEPYFGGQATAYEHAIGIARKGGVE